MSIGYKASKFNYIVRNADGYLIYNTLYNSLSRISEAEYKQYLQMDFESENLQKQFAEQGIIVNESIDELQQYNYYTKIFAKNISFKPAITVTPTMECNARCFYCYEEGVRCGVMQEESIEKIIDAIKTLDCSNGINLTWFGGEPLMNQSWMDSFSNALKRENISFSAFMITNGSKIDDDVLLKMKELWNVHNIQITLDGDNEEYVRRKVYTDQSENIYYQMLQRIKKISQNGISVQIRLNIDRNNMESIMEVASDISLLYKDDDKITCYPAFLTGAFSQLSEDEKYSVVKRLIEVSGNKIPVNNYLYKLPKITACYYNQRNAFSIDVNGDVHICEHMLGHKELSIGNIDNNINLNKVEREISGKRTECQSCVFLPKCKGGCFDSYKNGETPCFIDKYIIKAYLELL